MVRYSIIRDKNPREIVLLRGLGCKWRKCAFCDYHLDCSSDEAENFKLNKAVLDNVTGLYHHLEVINSGSFPELDSHTIAALHSLCKEKDIHTLHFECHWLYRSNIPAIRRLFSDIGTQVKIKLGVESFDSDFRESALRKGIYERSPAVIAEQFDECCLLFGLAGQTEASMIRDIETGLAHFERVCVNIFAANTTKLTPDEKVIRIFVDRVMPLYIGNDRVDILMNNTDFGVGANENDE